MVCLLPTRCLQVQIRPRSVAAGAARRRSPPIPSQSQSPSPRGRGVEVEGEPRRARSLRRTLGSSGSRAEGAGSNAVSFFVSPRPPGRWAAAAHGGVGARVWIAPSQASCRCSSVSVAHKLMVVFCFSSSLLFIDHVWRCWCRRKWWVGWARLPRPVCPRKGVHSIDSSDSLSPPFMPFPRRAPGRMQSSPMPRLPPRAAPERRQRWWSAPRAASSSPNSSWRCCHSTAWPQCPCRRP